MNVLEDLIQDVLEWLSTISGLVYYNIRDGLGDDNFIKELLDALLDIIGYAEHQDLFKRKDGS